jgi:hypothetical protein
MEKIYWTMRNGQKIDVDTMDIQHLRNTLKMIIRNKQRVITAPKPKFEIHGEFAQEHADAYEIYQATGIDIISNDHLDEYGL